MKNFKTKAGTELPLLDLRGKDYLQVAHRLVWFREEHPEASIETIPVELGNDYSVFKAIIKNKEGHILATAHKREDKQHFADHLEKAETSAIGRALAMCGYGTQFAPEIEEGERLSDSPTQPVKKAVNESSATPMHCGKKMMKSKYHDNSWYCPTCKATQPII